MLPRKLLSLLLPEGLVLLAAVALVHWAAATPSVAPVLRLFPLVVLVAGALLGWRFGRGRLLLALLGLAIADRAMLWLVPLESDAPHAAPAIVDAIATLLPASLAVLAWIPERGPLTAAGLRRLTVLGGESGVLLFILYTSAIYPQSVASAFDATLLPRWTLD